MLEGYFFMPRNRVSVEELRVRVMKLKNDVNWESTPYQAEKDMAQKYLSYVLNILDEYRF
jgi:predicted component of type VI protein secretion system|tara:strand:- start:208 stop:387 length:180 start_codon:yes stop_codon:yes gene_type:complete